MHEILSPEWEAEVRERYSQERERFSHFYSNFHFTDFGRFGRLDAKVRKFIDAGPEKQDVLLVGVGRRFSPKRFFAEKERICGTYPFELSGMFEESSKDYRMTILDFDKKNLSLVERVNRFKLPIADSPLGVIPISVTQYEEDTQQKLSRGHYLDIPHSFKKKRRG